MKKTYRFWALLLCVVMMLSAFAGCSTQPTDTTAGDGTTASGEEEPSNQEDTTQKGPKPNGPSEDETTSKEDDSTTKPGEDSSSTGEDSSSGEGSSSNEESSTDQSGEIDPPPVVPDAPLTSEPPKSIKILAIGNSFSTDCMEYLYQIAEAAGVENIVLGNLYKGGCSLAMHLEYATGDLANYVYYKNTTGTWNKTSNYKMSQALADEEWDYISLQQTSKTCGLIESYGQDLTDLVDYVRERNSTAKLVWNATWAYQQDSTHASFPNYNNDQMTMYNMILSCVEDAIMAEERFDIIIPCMTSIQNARTSFIGDKLTRDGYHLDYNIGRFIGGLTWFAAITNCSISELDYNPNPFFITDDMVKAAKEAVTNAILKPMEVTQSTVTEGSLPGASGSLDLSEYFERDSALAATYDIDLSQYTVLEWNYLENSFWNCTSRPHCAPAKEGSSTYQEHVCTDRKYTLDELPVGTIFISDPGWQFRIEIWDDANAKYTGTRPSMITEHFFTLTTAFMSGAQYLAWNISTNPTPTNISHMYAEAATHVRVYVPNTTATAE